MVLFLSAGLLLPAVSAAQSDDAAVQAVIDQLEAIDTLQEMQDKRSDYAVNSRYDKGSSDTIASAHEAMRTEYETYIAKMFAARLAAQQAYDQLTADQKAQIDPALTAKLSSELDTVFKGGTYPVTPRTDEYAFEAVANTEKGGLAYEVSNHLTAGPQIPATFILVDTSDGKTAWTPSGLYQCCASNYHVTYCCDLETGLEYGTHYKRVNLEDSGYYGPAAARHIRGILENSYPFLSLEEMKAGLIAGGLQASFVETLTRADIIAAVQMAVWAYANADSASIAANTSYGSTFDVTANRSAYMDPLHDYTNEIWTWWTTSVGKRSYDARAEYRVNTLVCYLCSLEAKAPADSEIVISDVSVTRADLVAGTDDTYSVGMYVTLNSGGSAQDSLKVTVTSFRENADGTRSVTAQTAQAVGGRASLEMTVRARAGDTIEVVVEGTQTLPRGVYFYEPEGGRNVSQCLVGVSQGLNKVRAETSFSFLDPIDGSGLRIYKSAEATGEPISDITFTVYRVDDGAALSPSPTDEELARYATEANKAGSLTTDPTGYADLALANGTYLVVEEFNAEKVKAPIDPFYLSIPSVVTEVSPDGTTTTETTQIISLYPKNEPVEPQEPTVTPILPDTVTGRFQILKYDAADPSRRLAGAAFTVYRPATPEDTDTETILCDGVQYAVVPVTVNGSRLVLTTDDQGSAVSPDLSCGLYFLVESKAPAGYHASDEAFQVTVVSHEMTGTPVVEIGNEAGTLLPETGGPGESPFWLLGGVLTAGALLAGTRIRPKG